MKTLHKLFYSAIVIFAFSACSGGTENSTPKTPKDILTGTEWYAAESYSKLVEITGTEPIQVLREGDAMGLLPLCISDNFIRFKADNTWETYTGTMKCPNEPATSLLARGRFELSQDGKTFTWKDVGTGANAWFTTEEVTTNTKVNKLTADYFEFEKTIETKINNEIKQVWFWRWGYKKK
jgi:hypothetical protein